MIRIIEVDNKVHELDTRAAYQSKLRIFHIISLDFKDIGRKQESGGNKRAAIDMPFEYGPVNDRVTDTNWYFELMKGYDPFNSIARDLVVDQVVIGADPPKIYLVERLFAIPQKKAQVIAKTF